jgi:hypothetical protein
MKSRMMIFIDDFESIRNSDWLHMWSEEENFKLFIELLNSGKILNIK